MKSQTLSEAGNRRSGAVRTSTAIPSAILLIASLALSFSAECFGGLKSIGSPDAQDHYVISKDTRTVKQDLSAIFSDIVSSEYNVTWRPDLNAYGSVNRRQMQYFTYLPNGFSVERLAPRDVADHWKITLRLKSYGGGNRVVPYLARPTKPDGHTIQFATDGLVDDYTNGPAGMRQDFVIQRKPNNGLLRLELQAKLQGVEMSVDKNSTDAYFINTATKHEVMRYGGLKVWDAKGMVLPARMLLLASDRLGIEVDDRSARYPVVVDPLSFVPGIAGPPQLGNKFGFSVAGGGNGNGSFSALPYGFILVGAPSFNVTEGGGQGKAFVYAAGPNGLNATAAWSATGTETNEQFGYSVAVSNGGAGILTLNGDGLPDIVVGSPTYGNAYQNGKVSVWFGQSGSSPFTASANWVSTGPQYQIQFGFAVAIVPAVTKDTSNNYYDSLVVGAPFYNNGSPGNGAAYAFYGSTTFSRSPSWHYYGTYQNAEAGFSVGGVNEIEGNAYGDVIVGEPYSSPGGRVYAFKSTGTLPSNPTKSIPTPGNTANAAFGFSVCGIPMLLSNGNGGYAVGAPGWPDALGNPNLGQVFAYISVSNPQALPIGPPSSANAGSEFGYALAGGEVDGTDTYGDLIIGAPYESNGSTTAPGFVYVYYGSGKGFYATPDVAADSNASAYFGTSVAWMPLLYDLNGFQHTGILIGAPNDAGGDGAVGAAYYVHP
jgi:hypothetical protein